MAIDLDAILKEQEEPPTTVVVLRGKKWEFRHLSNVPMHLLTDEIGDSVEEIERLALLLSNAVDPKQRKAFSGLELTVREAQALWGAIIKSQQGATPGESQASPASS